MTLLFKVRRGVVGLLQTSLLVGSVIGIATFGAGTAEAAKIQRVISPGGIEAWLEEEHTVPLITVSFGFKGGNSQDPVGKEGVANLLTTLFDEGAGDLDGQAFQSREEDISMELSFSQERDGFYGQFKALTENRDASFDLLALAVSKPHFADEAITRMQREVGAQIRNENKSPEAIAGTTWAKMAFPGHVYGRPSDGTEETLRTIKQADLLDYYKRVFARDGLKIGVVGDIDAATLAPLLDKVFGSLPAKQSLTTVADVVPKSGMESINYETPQTIIRFGAPGPKRTDPDFMATYLMNHILGGGGFSSWLYSEVREKRGLAYSIDTELIPRAHAGIFIGGVGTRGEKADESLDIIKQQIQRMADTGPTQAELDAAKAFVIGSYGLRFDTSEKIAGQLLAVQIDDLGIDYFDRRNAEVQAVTLDQVKAVAKKYLSNGLSVVIVGPKS
jgi:zinc protease